MTNDEAGNPKKQGGAFSRHSNLIIISSFVIRASSLAGAAAGRQAMFTPEWPMLGYRLDDAEPAISVA
jgi:hypothetical protein